ncbi:2,5-diamino-6-(ribosylamino)-4(3H)-pyrimidinone 5'-phosphate reductase [Agyrium rufum]|nr:2,5-diamino-6-(ribosylamino)-4(3H)-pyrimidinone 5'-phosphate reductase [Agyrium rufum]
MDDTHVLGDEIMDDAEGSVEDDAGDIEGILSNGQIGTSSHEGDGFTGDANGSPDGSTYASATEGAPRQVRNTPASLINHADNPLPVLGEHLTPASNHKGRGRQLKDPSQAKSTLDTRMPERDISDLLNPPLHIADMRQRLFTLSERIELKIEEFDKYWPYIDNVWVRQHRANVSKYARTVTDYYACRLQRPTYTPKTERFENGEPQRKKQIRAGGTCQMRFKTVRVSGAWKGIIITKVGDQEAHTHNLEHMDKIKRNTAVMEIARAEVMKGFMPASVYTIMNENPSRLAAIGGKFLGRNDVRNTSQAWRQMHEEPLAVHPGYQYDHGNGIVRSSALPLPPPKPPQIHKEYLDPRLAAQQPGVLHFPPQAAAFLEAYLPPRNMPLIPGSLPFVTLTYASSMDSFLSIALGVQTYLSGQASKAMTHYLRSRYDAILIGVGTALIDDPGLNCRLQGVGGFGGLGWDGQPRPVVLDPGARWAPNAHSKLFRAVAAGQARGPWIIIAPQVQIPPERIKQLNDYNGKYLGLPELDKQYRIGWETVLRALAEEGIRSVMIEGGGTVINDLLQPRHAKLINSVIVTIAPTYLGTGGVVVCPTRNVDANGRPKPVVRFTDTRWNQIGEDGVMCGRVAADMDHPNTVR